MREKRGEAEPVFQKIDVRPVIQISIIPPFIVTIKSSQVPFTLLPSRCCEKLEKTDRSVPLISTYPVEQRFVCLSDNVDLIASRISRTIKQYAQAVEVNYLSFTRI